MLDAVHRWEGTVNQFTGDGIMALFGAPIAHEDHAQRACHAALEIQRGFTEHAARLRREKGFAIQVRLGLNSGPVVVGAIGDDLRMDYTAQGAHDEPGRPHAAGGRPGFDPAWRRRRIGSSKGYFRVRPLGALRVRGAVDPVDAFVAGGGRARSSPACKPRCGAGCRRSGAARRSYAGSARPGSAPWRGHGEAICLVGEPGIGKSRLAFELQRHLGLAERAEGAAQAHARSAAYFAFRPLLRQLAAIGAGRRPGGDARGAASPAVGSLSRSRRLRTGRPADHRHVVRDARHGRGRAGRRPPRPRARGGGRVGGGRVPALATPAC